MCKRKPAYAVVDSHDDVTCAKQIKYNLSFTVIKGGAPDGGNLVKTDFNLPISASEFEIGKAIKDSIVNKFRGHKYRIGKTNYITEITSRTKNELFDNKLNLINYWRKGSMIGNYDELILNLRDVRIVPNKKSRKRSKVEYYISGRVYVDLGDGNIYLPRLDFEVNKQGRIIGYDIADIQKMSSPEEGLSPSCHGDQFHGR